MPADAPPSARTDQRPVQGGTASTGAIGRNTSGFTNAVPSTVPSSAPPAVRPPDQTQQQARSELPKPHPAALDAQQHSDQQHRHTRPPSSSDGQAAASGSQGSRRPPQQSIPAPPRAAKAPPSATTTTTSGSAPPGRGKDPTRVAAPPGPSAGAKRSAPFPKPAAAVTGGASAAAVAAAAAGIGHTNPGFLSLHRLGGGPSAAAGGFGSAIELGLSLVLLLVALKLAHSAWRFTRKRTAFSYVSFSKDAKVKDVVMVDCTHPSAPTLTHHKGHNNPAGLRAADTSTGLVLNALSASWMMSPAVWHVCQNAGVSSNHFDVDSFLAVWCYINRTSALQHASVLRHMARIGDFREAFLSPELVALHGAEDGVTNIRDAFTALKLVCWLNTLERKLFSAPYAGLDDEDRKFEYFLARFGGVLKDAEAAWSDWQDDYKQGTDGKPRAGAGGGGGSGGCGGGGGRLRGSGGSGGALTLRSTSGGGTSSECSGCSGGGRVTLSRTRSHPGLPDAVVVAVGLAVGEGLAESLPAAVQSAWAHWQDEYHQVVGGFDQLAGGHCSVELYPRVGLAVLCAPEPLHYYSLCSHSIGYDVILCMYEGNRYELEFKYTQFVNVHSRPVWPRLDMAALVTVLNAMEPGAADGSTLWAAPRFTDSGPLLRLERQEARLTKGQRYGHPFERTIHSSAIPPSTFSALVQSFLEFGMQGLRPRRGGWSWDELHSVNSGVAWPTWVTCCRDQHGRGELVPEGGCSQPLSRAGSAALSPTSRATQAAHDAGVELTPLERCPRLSEPSHILDSEELRAAVCAAPSRYALGDWRLVYCTGRHGISLHTLYRRAAGKSPTMLIVKDSGGAVFGAYASDPWRMGPRFYGTGETAVFTLRPRRALYSWRKPKVGHNDFFQFGTHEGLGVGGSGHFAFWLDNDLLEGSSNTCATFGSPCLASREDFNVAALELWEIS